MTESTGRAYNLWHEAAGDGRENGLGLVVATCIAGLAASAQQNPAPSQPETPGARDGTVDAAEDLVGKALILRGFYLADDLAYDSSGRVKGTPKIGDWTVAAMNVLKAERRGPGEIRLDGVRVAVRWNPDQQQFERHPLNDEKMTVLVDAVDEKQFRRAAAEIFAVGIDPALQRAMPDFWLHYFQPATPWPEDSLTAQAIYPMFGQAEQPKEISLPKPEKTPEPKYTGFALHDKVKGSVQVRLVVDPEGAVRRVVVTRPLGYGLDARVVESVRQWRFAPAMKDGKPVATGVVVAQEFVVMPSPRCSPPPGA